jgi:RHS repeat-associated protein
MNMRLLNNFKWAFFVISITAVFYSGAFGDDEVLWGGTHPSNDAKKPNSDKPLKNPARKMDPVLMTNGEYYASGQDFSIPGRVLGIAIKRQYGSRSEYDSRFGYGWDMNYNMKLRRLKDANAVVFLDGENRKIEYLFDANSNKYFCTNDRGNYFHHDDVNDTFTLFKKHGTKINFDINGNLSAITDRNGNSITCQYDPNGLMPLNGPSEFFLSPQFGGPTGGRGLVAMAYRLTTITDDLGRHIIFSYNSDGLVSTITDFASRTWTYTYDSANDLKTVQDPNGFVTEYTYDTVGKHKLLQIIDPERQTYITNVYDDANGFMYQQTYGQGTYHTAYKPDSNEATTTDRRGYRTRTVYNKSGNPIQETVYTAGLRQGDPASYTTRYEYNSHMEQTKKILPGGNYITYQYDPNGNLTCIAAEPNNSDPNIVTRFTYEGRFNFIKTMTDPKGNVTTYTYDYEDPSYITSIGNLMKIVYPMVETPEGNKNPTVNFKYNSYGQLTEANSPDGIVTKYDYYNTSSSDPNNGKLWKTTVDYGIGQNYLNLVTEFKYDTVGHVVKSKDPNGNTTQFAYNNIDELTQMTSPSPFNYTTSFHYHKTKKLKDIQRPIGGSTQTTSYTYNNLDQLKTITNPLGYITQYTYDNSENLSDVNDAENHHTQSQYDERNLPWKVIDANGSTTEYSYTPNGKLYTIKDAHGKKTTYDYDKFDRLLTITYPNSTTEVFTHDKNSNILSKKTRANQTINFGYDAMNRMVWKRRPNEPNSTFLYDIAGRLAEVDDNGKLTSYYYDRIGRVEEVNDSENRSVKYDYDKLGRRTKLTYPDSTYITYEYDQLSRLTKIKDSSGNTIASYGYDALSRRTHLTYANDANSVYEYDIANRLTKLINKINDGNSIVFQYSQHDKVGNRLNMVVDGNTHSYTYDCLYQLTNAAYPSGYDVNTTYHYDALGNRTSVVGSSAVNYSQNTAGLNQYGSVGGITYSYDNNGNLTYDGTYHYDYDCENRLVDVNAVASYTYDYSGKRISKTVGATTTKFCYDGSQIIAEYNGSTLVKKYIYGPGIDEPVCMIDVTDGNKKYYYHFDGLGSVVTVSDQYATVVEKYKYDVFGKPTICEPNGTSRTASIIDNRYMFAGREYDSESGLYYYRARYYRPEIGRFLQTDPVGYYDSMNLYLFCRNNQVNLVDPLGLWGSTPTTFWESARLGLKWATGLGSPYDSYGSGSSFANVMSQAAGVQNARQAFNSEFANSESGYQFYKYRPDYSLAFWKYYLSDKSALEKFLGSYNVEISKSCETLHITVTNDSTLGSFLGGWDFGYDRPRVVIPGLTDSYGTKPLPIPGASIYQNISWDEPVK